MLPARVSVVQHVVRYSVRRGCSRTGLPEGAPLAVPDRVVLQQGERVLVGAVQNVAGGMVKANTSVPVLAFLPLKGAIMEGIWTLKIERKEL